MRPPRYSDSACSKALTFGPVVIQPERSTSATAMAASLVGLANGRYVTGQTPTTRAAKTASWRPGVPIGFSLRCAAPVRFDFRQWS